MLRRPDAALDAARRAESVAERRAPAPQNREAVATALRLQAEALNRTNRNAEAFRAVTKASEFAASLGHLTKLDGDLAASRGLIAESAGDFALALKNYQQAHDLFARLGDKRGQAIALLDLGVLYEKARDFDREIRYYREAAQVYSGDPAVAFGEADNLGCVYLQMRRYPEAIARLQQSLGFAASLKSPVLEAMVFTNLALSYAGAKKLAEAEGAADRSLMLVSETDPDGEARFAWAAKAEIEYRRGALDAAAADLQKAFRGVDLKTTAPRFLFFHEIAYEIYKAKGDLAPAIQHLEAFKRLDDEGRSLAASVNLALLGAQFDFARQDLEIEHLKSAELERDIRLRKSQAELQAIVFSGVIATVILLLGWYGWRHAILKAHRNDIAKKNVELVKTLIERDMEIERRKEVECHLRVAMQAAQQANRAKSHFLANMSHELRTPLNAIIGFSEIMLSGRMNPEKLQEYARDIADGGRHLLAVLNNVLDMARIESGKVELEDHVIRLGSVVDHALSVLGGRNAHAGKELRMAGDSNILVRGDEVRLRQVIINLVSNAAKFTREGDCIEIRIERVEDGVDVTVQDNGEGIPADKLPVIMEPFGQADSTYARSRGGVGLGLPIVKSLVELHGGRFTIESDYGRGTTARLHLPEERVVDPDATGIQIKEALQYTAM
ncbi:MAG TPA: tetratricopeptide repeat-containing sensor histidine kinase [Rhizomicrobium sp.]|nr:tetratricopeptide repeat-containing sensor histidine kinase [Rhizomicrobium sp.]